MSATVDARGLSCPQPVLDTLNKIEELKKGVIEVLLDTEASKENVSRAAKSKGWNVGKVEDDAGGYRITINKD